MNKHHLDTLIESKVKHPKLTQEQIKWLNKCVNGTWEYKNGVVNVVDGDLDCSWQNLTSLPVQFGRVSGYFYCDGNQLTSLAGAPTHVGGYFSCDNNKLTSLAGRPALITKNFYCKQNPLILSDDLFLQLRLIGKEKLELGGFFEWLKEQIPIQFGITDETIIDEIWQSYMNILEGKNK